MAKGSKKKKESKKTSSSKKRKNNTFDDGKNKNQKKGEDTQTTKTQHETGTVKKQPGRKAKKSSGKNQPARSGPTPQGSHNSRDQVLARLNEDDTNHRARFGEIMDKLSVEEDKKLRSTNSSKFCSYFTYKKYTVVSDYLQLCKKVNDTDMLSGSYYELKQKLNNHSGNTRWKSYKLKGKTLMRPLSTNKKGNRFTSVICVDDPKTFDIIKKVHWNSDPKKHVGITQLHKELSKTYGGNITHKICEHFVKCCDVCNFKGNSAKKKKTDGIVRSGPFVFTCLDIRESFPDGYIESFEFKINPYLLICLFQDKSFFYLASLGTKSVSELLCVLVTLFQIIGHPTSVRYYSDKNSPVHFYSSQGKTLSIDEVSR